MGVTDRCLEIGLRYTNSVYSVIYTYAFSHNIFSLIKLIYKYHTFMFQFWLALHYLMTMTEDQTLAMYSGHPMGLFPSSPTV